MTIAMLLKNTLALARARGGESAEQEGGHASGGASRAASSKTVGNVTGLHEPLPN